VQAAGVERKSWRAAMGQVAERAAVASKGSPTAKPDHAGPAADTGLEADAGKVAAEKKRWNDQR
jgi:hypothetical protein